MDKKKGFLTRINITQMDESLNNRNVPLEKTHLSSILENQLTSTSRQINKLEGPWIIIKKSPKGFLTRINITLE